MFSTCRQLSRLSSHQNAAVRIFSVNNDTLTSVQSRSYSGNSADDGQKDAPPNYSRSFCPFVLAKNLTDYVGLIGTGFIVGLKLQCDLCRLKHVRARTSSDPVRDVAEKTGQTVMSIRNHFVHFPVFPFFVLSASRVLHRNGIPSLSSPVQPLTTSSSTTRPDGQNRNDNEKRLASGRTLNDYRKELMSLSKNYTADLMNKIGVGLIESQNGSDGIECLKANATCAKALYNLAIAYETGRHSDQTSEPDLKLAFEYYDRAARLNHKFATYNLALFYLYGKGPIERDPVKGGMLMRLAFEMGVDRAATFKNFVLPVRVEQPQRSQAPIAPPAVAADSRPWNLIARLMSSSSSRNPTQSDKSADMTTANSARLAICY